MPDLAESLIDVIQAHFAATYPSVTIHVGEYVPQNITTGFVWISQASEQFNEDDLSEEVDKKTFACEIGDDDIQNVRTWTASLKTALRAKASHHADWNSNAQFVTVSDASDDYIPVNFDSDNPKFISSLQLVFDL